MDNMLYKFSIEGNVESMCSTLCVELHTETIEILICIELTDLSIWGRGTPRCD